MPNCEICTRKTPKEELRKLPVEEMAFSACNSCYEKFNISYQVVRPTLKKTCTCCRKHKPKVDYPVIGVFPKKKKKGGKEYKYYLIKVGAFCKECDAKEGKPRECILDAFQKWNQTWLMRKPHDNYRNAFEGSKRVTT